MAKVPFDRHRRIAKKPVLQPDRVWELASDHLAVREDRTLFPTTVVDVTWDQPQRLLIDGFNSRKIGRKVEKGSLKGYKILTLTLEERATCPRDCAFYNGCYGNAMPLARRHRVVDESVLCDRLEFELVEHLNRRQCVGILVRLHVLGDFFSESYVRFWEEMLDTYPNLAVFGYTHWKPSDGIGDEILRVKRRHTARFRIRWSSERSGQDRAVVIDHVPQKPHHRPNSHRIPQGVVCPAQTDATTCCATCAFCWEPSARFDTVVFIKHGPTRHSRKRAA